VWPMDVQARIVMQTGDRTHHEGAPIKPPLSGGQRWLNGRLVLVGGRREAGANGAAGAVNLHRQLDAPDRR
jgi:hypothetical protein